MQEDDFETWPMITGCISQSICGIDELTALSPGVTHMLSILDPDFPDPHDSVTASVQTRLCLRFHDILTPKPGLVEPAPRHIQALLAFGQTLGSGDAAHLLVHCHMGVSRSTAAMAILLAQANPEADDGELISHVEKLRPQAWPNLLMVTLADQELNRRGRLLEALKLLYRRRMERDPALPDVVVRWGRKAEVDFALS